MLVDDEAGLLRAWQRLFALKGIEVVAALQSSSNVLAEASAAKPDVVVLDLTIPGENPLDAIAPLAQADPRIPVLVYSGQSDRDSICAAREAGAAGYVDKLSTPEAMLMALSKVVRGELVFPPGT